MSVYKSILVTGVCAAALVGRANAEEFNISRGDLKTALSAYAVQTGTSLVYVPNNVAGVQTDGVRGNISADEALVRILRGTGFTTKRFPSGAIGIDREQRSSSEMPFVLAQSAPSRAAVETVTVTSSKLGGADVQSIPIAITALSQEQLTATQTAGGPDLVKQIPNLTFTKTNFTGYSIQIRGIGTQAVSVTTDPAVAVAFNDTPFIRNHFFEQEFFDVSQVEVLRGPQGTLYGRNATAGVVNLISAKPTDQYEAMGSVDVGNYNNRRLEGMLNVPIVGDKFGIRIAGEWTKRDGYTFNSTTDKSVDGRDLWSGRVTVGFKPAEHVRAYAIWEHFQEDDDRMRTAKQLCKKDEGPSSVAGLDLVNLPDAPGSVLNQSIFWRSFMSQGCLPTSLYSKDAFQTPNGLSIPFVFALASVFNGGGGAPGGFALPQIDPYASKTQSTDLRVIESELSPNYKAKNDTFEFNADVDITNSLTFSSQTGYGKDRLRSTEDFNRFNTRADIFPSDTPTVENGNNPNIPPLTPDGRYCDPQLGCASRIVGEDLSQERAWQFSQELRVASHFDGPFNFSVGANYLHYQTVEDYYVFFNLISMLAQTFDFQGRGDNFDSCYSPDAQRLQTPILPVPYFDPDTGLAVSANASCGSAGTVPAPGTYIDPNSIDNLDGNGHNYFRSQNPYRLNSFAGFGEAYYQIAPDLKLTAGLRWTDDRKRFFNVPSWTLTVGGGYPILSVVDQEWREWTGRFNASWTPKLDFTDQSMFYASYSRGYKGGGANPPGPIAGGGIFPVATIATHPPTFAPEFVNAYEVGTKNELLDGGMTLNADIFYYDYKGYQISQIVDRTAVNMNFDARVHGAEMEATWEPLPGLRFNLSGGYEDSSINKGQSAIDLIDRTAGNTDWVVIKPFVTETSNCIVPAQYMRDDIQSVITQGFGGGLFTGLICDLAYSPQFSNALGLDPQTAMNLIFGASFDPSIAPNNGAGFSKDLSGNKLPNTPPFTLSAGAQYSMPLSESWAGTLRGDFYWQGNSFARIFNDKPYDQLHGYTNVNLALIFTNQDGWQAMFYAKNVFDTTAITGAFLNSDDTALTTNVFLTDPRLFGIRITKNW